MTMFSSGTNAYQPVQVGESSSKKSKTEERQPSYDMMDASIANFF
jgi:hypothetical protein